ncbi:MULTISPECIES: ParA family protein [Cyanophyceae]|uniref:ParA family protein n=1 Tax=Leptolyngbya subtilissima DQ-A4 TaxID=2933933 RepID=A0ABV0KC17_9CYAN|nr:ParA family protein [Nodosilinea sp. FACHB-141]MBD2115255.1 ParA family protein [Nodosilinea sp. FACHB-141]
MIISLIGWKGGISKTTSAICLATLLARQGKTLLIDSDPNRSASLWARKGKLPFTTCTDNEAARELMSGGYQHTVIDTPARPGPDDVVAIARGADLLILPTTPDPLALSALVQLTQELPEGANYRCLVTISPPSPQTDGAEAIQALKRHGLPVFERAIRRRKEYIHAANEGRTVRGIAWHDWEAVWRELNDGKVG